MGVATRPPGETWVAVTPNRGVRTVLSLAFPGKVALRPMQDCLAVAAAQTHGRATDCRCIGRRADYGVRL
jgi:hypothetical protein